jgi:N-acetylmuramoyl-L-alanine amidase
MSEKITYNEYLELARNPETEDDALLSYSRIERGKGGFDFAIRPDPEKVEMTDEDTEFENALQIGNGLSRFRRQMRFRRRKLFGSDLPVLVSEGDSWFQFPLLVREIIDQLDDDYLVWSVGAAGDTAENIVYGRAEYLDALTKERDNVRGFLFSAAGNDIIGEDPKTQRAVLLDILKDFNGDTNDIEGHVDMDLLAEKLDFLKGAYTKVIEDIRATPGFENLPIFIHGYDYAFPYPWGDDDPRDPIHADKNQWLGKPLDQHQINDQQQRRNIIKYLIDRLYLMLAEISGNSQETGVWLVNFRGAMSDVSDWIDEIHGTSDGFKKIAARLKPVLSELLI